MVKKFEFKDDVQLNINGAKFSFDSTDIELLEKLDKFGESTEVFTETIVDRDDQVQAIRETIQFTVDAIDEILGVGATKEIFQETPVSLNKAIDIIQHINDAVVEARMKKTEQYSPARAQRN